MANKIIAGIVASGGWKIQGEGYDIERVDNGYQITFPESSRGVPVVLCQAVEHDDVVTFVTVSGQPDPAQVTVAALESASGGNNYNVQKTFSFIAVIDN